MIVDAKFMIPVRVANIVPSIFLGVIFAKRARMGSVYSIVTNVSKTMSVKSKNAMSGMPISRFHRLAKVKFRNELTDPEMKATSMIVRVSIDRRNDLYMIAPNTLQIEPKSSSIANVNFEIWISFSRKK